MLHTCASSCAHGFCAEYFCTDHVYGERQLSLFDPPALGLHQALSHTCCLTASHQLPPAFCRIPYDQQDPASACSQSASDHTHSQAKLKHGKPAAPPYLHGPVNRARQDAVGCVVIRHGHDGGCVALAHALERLTRLVQLVKLVDADGLVEAACACTVCGLDCSWLFGAHSTTNKCLSSVHGTTPGLCINCHQGRKCT